MESKRVLFVAHMWHFSKGQPLLGDGVTQWQAVVEKVECLENEQLEPENTPERKIR